MSRARLIATVLALVTLISYSPVGTSGFSIFDDYDYVAGNPDVQQGLSWAGIRWAFTTGHAGNWHPLTWISHMADCQFFGLKPGAHHVVNAVLHSVNALLVFALLLSLTDKLWPAAFAAALFAWHPLRVESVAWISERKDVLSAFFALLTLLAYTRAVRRPAGAGDRQPASLGIWRATPAAAFGALLCFALSLLAKPMPVMLPLVLLLLDYWPLRRTEGKDFQPSTLRRLIVEKWPFFALSVVVSAITLVVQREGGMMLSFERAPLDSRLGLVPLAYEGYLFKLIWPARLAAIYQRPGAIAAVNVFFAVLLLALISLAAWRGRKRAPYWLVGWLWYLALLVPVIGFAPAGGLFMADRYTYLSTLGIGLAIALTLGRTVETFGHLKGIVVAGAGLILVACLVLTGRQLRYWRDDVSLFSRVIEVEGDSGFAHLRLGVALERKGRKAEALDEYRLAAKLEPGRAEAHRNIANLVAEAGDPDEARAEYERALQLNPGYVSAHFNLGLLLARTGQADQAIAEYSAVVRLDREFAEARYNLGCVLAQRDRLAEATAEFTEAARLDPSDWRAPYQLGRVLLKQNRGVEAVRSLRNALQAAPDNPLLLGYLAQVLASHEQSEVRDGRAAFALAQQALALTGHGQPRLLEVLAMAYAELGQYDDARRAAQDALDLVKEYGLTNHLPVIERELQLYRNRQPCRQSFTNTTLAEPLAGQGQVR